MSKIKIETLTPVHIGSGRELMRNTEFLHFKEDDEDLLSVIDEEKVFNIIGEENIDKWVNIIEQRDDLKKYLAQRKPDLKSADISKRSMVVYASDYAKNQSLKEQLHDGRGKRYIPGSSIKGAIRTAILAQKALQNVDLAKRRLKDKYGFSGQELEKNLFGSNPNEDVFRFLQIGDAFFDFKTIALKAEIFNIHGRGWKFKPGGSQLIETIPNGAIARFNLKINKDLLKLNSSNFETDFLSEKKLFELVNKHTINLLEQEIEFWNDEKAEDIETKDAYLEQLSDLLDEANSCSQEEAILRIGFGSGWRFITGGWATNKEIMSDPVYDKFLSVVRRKNYPDEIPFPKSRKIGDQADIFGFVKLTANG